MKILGLMTGTSCDALDAACLSFPGRSRGDETLVNSESWKPLWTKSTAYPHALRQRVLGAQLPDAKLSLKQFGELHRDLGLWIARSVVTFLRNIPAAQRPDAIGFHGQTVAHFPAAKKQGFTIQLGDPARIVEATGLTVISNFRDGDMAAGGEGAPLAPRFHQLLARNQTGIAIHNLGGISNLTYLGPHNVVLALDTGPANLWIDAATQLVSRGKQKFDRDGKIAAGNYIDAAAMDRLLRDRFFKRRPPKSTGRDDFPFSKLLKATKARDGSLVSTATALTVETIVRAYEQFILKRALPLEAIYFSGGGARNKFLLETIRALLPDIHIATIDDLGVDSQYLESYAFAYFAYIAVQGISLGGPWTGVPGWTPPAHITPGRNWPALLRQLARANSSTPSSPA